MLSRTMMVSLAAIALGCTPTPAPSDTGTTPGNDAAPGTDAGRDTGTTPGDDAGAIDGGNETAPVFRNAVDLPDAELAQQALRLMGATAAGGSGSCADCHAMTRDNIAHFRQISDTAWSTCFADLAVTTPEAAQSVVHCLQDQTGHYTTSHAGIFATGGSFDWFRFVFRRAFGDASWQTEYAAFTNRTQMSPAPYAPFTQAEFDLLTEWFIRGTPNVNDVIPPADGPGECTSYVDGSVATIVAQGATTGWSARNAHSLLMYGCAGAASPSDCLSTLPRASTTTYGAMWDTAGSHMRVLYTLPYHSSYWTRSSPDGRFVAHGGGSGSGASFVDLVRGIVIGADASYDPGFFPDNSGFIFQGGGTAVCELSVLTTGAPTHLTLSEPGCSHPGNIGLYQHVGASLDGSDYWAVNSLWSGDPGYDMVDPDVFVDANGDITLIRMLNGGGTFTDGGSFHVSAPWQGNAVISPSMRMMVTELATAAGAPLGYVLHRLDISRDASGAVTGVAAPEIARYCVPGGKPAISLDDRWLITHHRATDADAVDLGFTGPTDPAFAAYRGISNMYLIDLRTGHETRISNMQPGQRALFPHFRSDGWIYFLVRDDAGPERIVATDAALVLGN